MKYLKIAAAIAAVAVLSLACSKKKENVATAFPDSLVSDEVVATVNGDPILGGDVTFLAYSTTAASPDSLHNRQFNERVLDQMIDRIVFYQDARTSGVSVADTLVEKMVSQFITQFGGEERVATMLDDMGLKRADVTRSFQRDMVIREFVQKHVEPSIEVKEDDSRAFYDQHKDSFASVDSVHARHIILMFRPEDTPEIKADRLKQITDIQKRAKSGEDFAGLARQYSQDGAARSGGDLGYFPREMMVKPFADVAFSLKKGEISGVVETQFGYHVIQCLDHKKAAEPTYENARPRVDAMLRQQALGEELQNRLKRDRDAAIIVRNYKTGA
jgi:parvulin-like peptidyl-prolyl isomerase